MKKTSLMANRKIRILALFLSVAVLFAISAVAHEGGKHFFGSVKSINSATLTITTRTNEVVVLKLLPSTAFIKSGHPASGHDLRAGDRVVVHAKQNGTSWDAEEVRFGTTQSQPISPH